jgi:acyl-coenzyme A thioesterase PaaI-like protein
VLLDPGTLALPKTITVTTDYLRSARPEDTRARARIVRRGRRVAVIEARAEQGEPAATVAVAVVHVLLAG